MTTETAKSSVVNWRSPRSSWVYDRVSSTLALSSHDRCRVTRPMLQNVALQDQTDVLWPFQCARTRPGMVDPVPHSIRSEGKAI